MPTTTPSHEIKPRTMSSTSPTAASAQGGSAGVMRALFKHHAGPGLEMATDRPIPQVGPRDVLIRVKKAGICGTDRHIWEWDQWAANRIPCRDRHGPRVRGRNRESRLRGDALPSLACA